MALTKVTYPMIDGSITDGGFWPDVGSNEPIIADIRDRVFVDKAAEFNGNFYDTSNEMSPAPTWVSSQASNLTWSSVGRLAVSGVSKTSLADNRTVQDTNQTNSTQQNQQPGNFNNMAQVALYNFQIKNQDWWNKDNDMTQFANAQTLILSNDPQFQQKVNQGDYVSFFTELQNRCDRYKKTLQPSGDFEIPSDGSTFPGTKTQDDAKTEQLVKRIIHQIL